MRAPFACRSRAFSAACTASLRACRIVHTVFALVPCAISLKNALDPFHCAYSTVTDFARFLGLSMSVPRARALHADWISVFQAAHHSAQSQQPAWRLSQARAVRV